MNERGPVPERKAPQSETLAQLLPGVVPGATLTIHTGRTDYSIRVDNCEPSGDKNTRHIGGTVIDAMGKIMPGASIHFFCPIAETGQALRFLLPGGNALATSAVRGFSLESPAVDLNAYKGERWMNRFTTEKSDPKRAMQALLQILPDEIHVLENEAGSLASPGVMNGVFSREEYAAQEAERQAQAEQKRQQVAWLKGAYTLFQEMLPGDTIVSWEVGAKKMGWEAKHVQYAMQLVAYLVKPHMNSRIGDPKNHFAGMNTASGFEKEAQRLLGLRDAKGLLKSMEKADLPAQQ